MPLITPGLVISFISPFQVMVTQLTEWIHIYRSLLNFCYAVSAKSRRETANLKVTPSNVEALQSKIF